MLIPILLSPAAADGGEGSGTTGSQGGLGGTSGGEAGNASGAGESGGSGGEGQGNGEGDTAADLYDQGDGQGQEGQPRNEGSEGSGEVDGNESGDAGDGGEGQPQPQSTNLSKEDLIEIFSKSGIAIPQQAQGNQQQSASGRRKLSELSEPEYNKLFNVYQPTPDVLAGLRSEDPNVQMVALAHLRDGLVRQATTMAEYRAQEIREELSNQINPLNDFVRTQQEEKLRSDFFRNNNDLKKYEIMVDAVANKLQVSGQLQNKSLVDCHKLIAKETRNALKVAGIQVNLPRQGQNGRPASQGQPQPQGGVGGNRPQNGGNGRRMSTLLGGGQKSGNRTQAGPLKGPSGIEVFD